MPTRPPLHGNINRSDTERNRKLDEYRRTEQPWRRWYSTARWRRIRQAQLDAHPLCTMCKAEGRVTEATVCDHAIAHRGDEKLFWYGPFASLCKHHHDSDAQRRDIAHAHTGEAPRGG